MFRVDYLQFGRVSWYYEAVYGSLPLGDIGFQHFTPLDLGGRWISRQADWGLDSRIIALAGGDSGFDRYLVKRGFSVISSANLSQECVAGGYLIAEAGSISDILAGDCLDHLYRIIFPFGKLLMAVQLPFASNHGFDHVCDVAENEKAWLAKPADSFSRECNSIFHDFILESPAVLARLIVNRLNAFTEPSFADCTVERFVFDPDVMTTPIGRRVVDKAAAQLLQSFLGERADRCGVLLLALSRTARI